MDWTHREQIQWEHLLCLLPFLCPTTLCFINNQFTLLLFPFIFNFDRSEIIFYCHFIWPKRNKETMNMAREQSCINHMIVYGCITHCIIIVNLNNSSLYPFFFLMRNIIHDYIYNHIYWDPFTSILIWHRSDFNPLKYSRDVNSHPGRKTVFTQVLELQERKFKLNHYNTSVEARTTSLTFVRDWLWPLELSPSSYFFLVS